MTDTILAAIAIDMGGDLEFMARLRVLILGAIREGHTQEPGTVRALREAMTTYCQRRGANRIQAITAATLFLNGALFGVSCASESMDMRRV